MSGPGGDRDSSNDPRWTRVSSTRVGDEGGDGEEWPNPCMFAEATDSTKINPQRDRNWLGS